jgi:membrane protein
MDRERNDPGRPTDEDAQGTSGSRLSTARDWLSQRADTSLGRLTLIWFRRYFEASRNSGAAASVYLTLSVLPTALVLIALLNKGKGDDNALADHLIAHLRLDGQAASLVHDLFGTTANNLLAASLTVVIGFLIWGLSIGVLYQDVYARAWRITVGSPADQALFTIWFFVVSGLLALMTLSASSLRTAGWLALLPAWIAGSLLFWLWTPRFLLHRKVSIRSLMPGALLATFVIGGTVGTSPLWIGPTLSQNAKAFGSFGVILALFAYILIVATISMVCAVFSPVWAEWRQGEAIRSTQPAEVTPGQPVPSAVPGADELPQPGG